MAISIRLCEEQSTTESGPELYICDDSEFCELKSFLVLEPKESHKFEYDSVFVAANVTWFYHDFTVCKQKKYVKISPLGF